MTNSQITVQNFVAIPISLGVTGTYDQALPFVDGLQHGTRLFLVTAFASGGSSSPSSASGGSSAGPSSWIVGGFAYVLLDPKQAKAVK